MGKKGPRRGSMAYWPRVRAANMSPRVRAWNTDSKGLTGFAGYKAGMTSIVMVDDSNSPTKGQEIVKPVTIVEVPPIHIFAIVGYKNEIHGLRALTQINANNMPKELKRAIRVAKQQGNIADLEKHAKDLSEIRVMASTNPVKAAIGKKTPDILEIALGGSISEQLETAKTLLGKEVNISDVFKDGTLVDAIAVTKGKGWQGLVKRFGVALNPHKATAHRRKGGSLGAETQARVFYTIPRPGQMGFHRRTDANKRIVKISKDATPLPVFKNYGPIKSQYIILEGSIPGPAKRLIKLRLALEAKEAKAPTMLTIIK